MLSKKYHTIIILCLGMMFTSINAQQKKSIDIESKNSYAEKIYLQPTSTVFTNDKTIWFKAIVTDLEHFPTKLSAVLHVDLIDFDQKIIESKLLKIENGVAEGYFNLNKKLASGRYLIRAFTEWNKNFGNEFTSQTYINIYAPKEIKKEDQAIRDIVLQATENQQYQISAKAFPQLINPKYKGKLKMYIHTNGKTDSLEIKKDKDNLYSFSYMLPKDAVKARLEIQLDSVRAQDFHYKHFSSYSKTIAINKEYIDLQFFPEGGKLVNGLTSKIAFKALNYKNKGILVSGNIIDEQNNIITSFKSNALGMGTTTLTPNIQKKYFANIKGLDQVAYKYPLPNIYKNGLVLNVKEEDGLILLSLKSNQENQENLHVKAQVRGVVFDEFDLVFIDQKVGAGIDKNKLPDGIVKFTITNASNQIIAERLFFNEKESQRIKIATNTHQQTYKQREKTVLNIRTMNMDSLDVQTNLSVLVINKKQLGKEHSLHNNILSYFLLNSELRGNIENPNEYFNPKNKTRKSDMDVLLLTQGWSNYKYENTTFANNFKYLPEKGLTISGRIKNLWFSKSDIKKPVELTAVYGPLNVAIQQIDSTGRFNLNLEDYYNDKFRVAIQTKNQKGKKKNFMVGLDRYQLPQINFQKEEKVIFPDSINTYVKENIIKKEKEDNIKPADGVIELEEVKLTGYQMTPQRQKMMDLHGAPDVVIENEELIKNAPKWHYGIFNVLDVSFPSISNFLNAYTSNGTTGGGLNKLRKIYYLVDGILVDGLDFTFFNNLTLEEIKSVELLKNPKASMTYFGLDNRFNRSNIDMDPETIFANEQNAINTNVAFLCVYTYTGKGIRFVKKNKGINKFNVQGFATKAEFYAPKYNDDFDWNTPDLRSIVHWSPIVNTDELGEAKVEYYNADNTGEMLVIVEGITKKGKFGYYETSYRVEER